MLFCSTAINKKIKINVSFSLFYILALTVCLYYIVSKLKVLHRYILKH